MLQYGTYAPCVEKTRSSILPLSRKERVLSKEMEENVYATNQNKQNLWTDSAGRGRASTGITDHQHGHFFFLSCGRRYATGLVIRSDCFASAEYHSPRYLSASQATSAAAALSASWYHGRSDSGNTISTFALYSRSWCAIDLCRVWAPLADWYADHRPGRRFLDFPAVDRKSTRLNS